MTLVPRGGIAPSRVRAAALILASGLSAVVSPAARAATPAELLTHYRAAAQPAAAPSADQGRQFFTSTHGREWSCTSCHGPVPTAAGRHVVTGKPISALAPSANAERFTDAAKTEKWFRRNCRDVVGRECSAAEKASVLAWLITLTP